MVRAFTHGAMGHWIDPSFQPVLHDWCTKGCGMCYPVCGMVHIKGPLLLIGKSSPCGGRGFPLSLSVTLLEVSGPLKTRSGLEPILRCEHSTYQPISR